MPDSDITSSAAEQGAWGRPLPARIGEIVTALGLLAAAVLFIWQSLYLPFGGVGLPGPGFFPFGLGIALAVVALAILLRGFWMPKDVELVYLGHRDVLITMAALFGVAFAFEQVDSYVVLGVFAAVLLLFVAHASIWRVVLGSVLGMIGVWLVFKVALGVRLPASEFWTQLVDLLPSWQAGNRP